MAAPTPHRRPHKRLWLVYASLGLFLCAAAYIHFHSLTTPASGIVAERNASGQWFISSILPASIAEGWQAEPGDRLLSFDGRSDPKLFIHDGEKLVTGFKRVELEDRNGTRRTIVVEPGAENLWKYGVSFLSELFLLGVGVYAVRKVPESRLIRQFFALNLVLAACFLTMFSDEMHLSNYAFSFCAVWLPYCLLTFYLSFAFRSMQGRFRPLLVGYRLYSAAFSGVIAYGIVNGNIGDWASQLLNMALIGTLLMMAGLTAFYWKRFDRIEKNHVLVLVCGTIAGVLPYLLLYAYPFLLGQDHYVPLEYTFISLVPVSGILTYLLVRRQMLDMKFYVPRMAVHGLYYGATLGLFLTAAASGSAFHAASLFALFGLLTYGYRRVLLRLRKRETRTIERLQHQKLRLSLQLAEKSNIREIIKLFAELLHETIEVQGLVLVYYDDEGSPIAHGTGIYEGKWAFGSAEPPDEEPPFVRTIELTHGSGERSLGRLYLGPKTNMTMFSSEEQRVIEKFRVEAIQMLLNVRLLFRLQNEYNMNKERMDRSERRFRDFQTYSRMLLEAREEEKIKISYFLHDDLLQNLIFLSRDLEELHDTGRYDPERTAAWLKCLYDSQRSIRSMSDTLYPHILDKGDFQDALRWLLLDMNRSDEVAVSLQYDAPSPEPFPAYVKTNLFRAVRELVVNAFKHAEASELQVSVWLQRDFVCCSVSDNGKGFSDAADLRRSGSVRSRFGLMSVCDRMERLGGSAKIDSVPGRGTSVTLKMPLRKEGELIL